MKRILGVMTLLLILAVPGMAGDKVGPVSPDRQQQLNQELYTAVFFNNVNEARELIQQGADPYAKLPHYGQITLATAIGRSPQKSKEMVNFLLDEVGIDPRLDSAKTFDLIEFWRPDESKLSSMLAYEGHHEQLIRDQKIYDDMQNKILDAIKERDQQEHGIATVQNDLFNAMVLPLPKEGIKLK